MANLDHCPICNVSVKPENLLRHLNDIHPRHPDTPRLREELKEELARVPSKKAKRTFRMSRVQVAILALVVAGALLGYYLVTQPSSADVVTSCGVEGTVVHYHPLLVINANGVQQHLPYDTGQPADIGYISQPGYTNSKYYCPAGQLHWLHTHDGSGIVHVELPRTVSTDPTLGDFFTIWGEPLTPSQAWTFSGQLRADVYNSDARSSTDYSSNPRSIPLYEPAAGPRGNAYPIPSSLTFNGVYGSGASGGFFSGEIIWLNITT